MEIVSLSLVAASRQEGPLVLDLTDKEKLVGLKKNPITIKVRLGCLEREDRES